MVSHAEVADSRASRRAPSVSSRSRTHSRSHHHRGRSHAGGSSYAPRNEFPFFEQTGDVEIVIAADGLEKRYLLHRLILAQCSGFFEAGTSEEWSRSAAMQEIQHNQQPRTEQALTVIGEDDEIVEPPPAAVTPAQMARAPPGRRRWRYELNWDAVDEEEEPILVQKPAIDPALSSALIRDYDNLFRIFYNHSPALNDLNIASAYSECKSLLNLADMYDALPVVGSRVDHHLLRFSSRLFKQIAKYPPSYLKLGYLARSRIIFSEALTHVVGQWPHPYPYLKEQGYEVPDSVIDLIEDKVDELEELKAKVEAKLFRLTLTTSRGERVNPSNDYLGWLAMSLFRQWLAESTTPPPAGILKNTAAHNTPPRPGSNGPQATQPGHPPPAPTQPPPLPASFTSGRVYRLIGSTNSQAYLPHDELKKFLKIHPSRGGDSLYTRDNLRRFERKVDEVKNVARDLVKPLTRVCLEGGIGGGAEGTAAGGGLGYLVCMRVEEAELPWD